MFSQKSKYSRRFALIIFISILGTRDTGKAVESGGNAGEANSLNDARQRGAD